MNNASVRKDYPDYVQASAGNRRSQAGRGFVCKGATASRVGSSAKRYRRLPLMHLDRRHKRDLVLRAASAIAADAFTAQVGSRSRRCRAAAGSARAGTSFPSDCASAAMRLSTRYQGGASIPLPRFGSWPASSSRSSETTSSTAGSWPPASCPPSGWSASGRRCIASTAGYSGPRNQDSRLSYRQADFEGIEDVETEAEHTLA